MRWILRISLKKKWLRPHFQKSQNRHLVCLCDLWFLFPQITHNVSKFKACLFLFWILVSSCQLCSLCNVCLPQTTLCSHDERKNNRDKGTGIMHVCDFRKWGLRPFFFIHIFNIQCILLKLYTCIEKVLILVCATFCLCW